MQNYSIINYSINYINCPKLFKEHTSKSPQVVKIKLEICYAGNCEKTSMHRGYISEILDTMKILYGANSAG